MINKLKAIHKAVHRKLLISVFYGKKEPYKLFKVFSLNEPSKSQNYFEWAKKGPK